MHDARAFERRKERAELLPFLLAADKEHRLPVQPRDCFQAGIDVGRLGIVDVDNAVFFEHLFEAVRDSLEGRERRSDRLVPHAHELCRGNGGKGVCKVVLPAHRKIVRREHLLPLETEVIVLQICAFDALFHGKPHGLRLGVLGKRTHDRVVAVEDGVLALRAVFEQFALQIDVVFHVVVAVEVVFRDIEDDGDVRAQGGERLLLKGGDFDGGNAAAFEFLRRRSEREPAVPTGETLLARRAEDAFEHGDGGRLAVGARDGDGGAGKRQCAQLHLPRHPLPVGAEKARERVIDGDPGAQNEDVALFGAL